MAGYDNIKNENSRRTPDERRELAIKAGKASGAARRRKASMRETMNRLLTMQAEVPGLSDVLRADGGESTYEEIISMAMIIKASQGDVAAYNAIKATVGQTDRTEADLEEQRIRTDRARRARDQELGTENNNENIQNFLNAMRPSEEALDSLFADNSEGEEEDSDAEETETSG